MLIHVPGIQTVSNTTQATSIDNGSLVVHGVVGIAKDVNTLGNLFVGGTEQTAIAGQTYITDTIKILILATCKYV